MLETPTVEEQFRVRLIQIAKDFGGKLVVWIAQMENPSQVKNKNLVAQGNPLGIPEATAGVCFAIVTEFTRLMLTAKDSTIALESFQKEMKCIPDRYRDMQAKIVAKMEAFRLAAHLVHKNVALAEQWNRLILEGRAATDSIMKFWQEQLDLSVDSANRNAARTKALSQQLYITDNIVSAGINWKVKQHNVAIDAKSILALIHKESGCYMIGLQGPSKGHAVGAWICKPWFSANSYMFIDPNSGVFQFDNENSFTHFVEAYWNAYLREFQTGVIVFYDN